MPDGAFEAVLDMDDRRRAAAADAADIVVALGVFDCEAEIAASTP